MICPNCGKIMVEFPPTVIFTSKPPKHKIVNHCYGCDVSVDLTKTRFTTMQDLSINKWKEMNGINV